MNLVSNRRPRCRTLVHVSYGIMIIIVLYNKYRAGVTVEFQ